MLPPLYRHSCELITSQLRQNLVEQGYPLQLWVVALVPLVGKGGVPARREVLEEAARRQGLLSEVQEWKLHAALLCESGQVFDPILDRLHECLQLFVVDIVEHKEVGFMIDGQIKGKSYDGSVNGCHGEG